MPSAGSILVFGRPPLHPELHGRVTILPQDAALVRGVAVENQLAFFARLQGFTSADAKKEAARVLELVLLTEAAKRPPEALSHGMLKRVAIAQTFIGAPELVLLDEPTAGLDPASAAQIKNIIRTHAQDRAFIITSHNLDDIEELCGSVVILKGGKVTENRAVADLVARASVLSFKLEKDPPANVASLFSAVSAVTKVETGRPGERLLVVHYLEADGNATQITVLQTLASNGLAFVEMSRGRSLQDKVIEMTR
jgi:ABC-2 type transport system ATP-binding protein